LIDNYFHIIKTLVDSLATIQSPISYLELIQLTTAGLQPNYHTLVTAYSMIPNEQTYYDLRYELISMSNVLNFT